MIHPGASAESTAAITWVRHMGLRVLLVASIATGVVVVGNKVVLAQAGPEDSEVLPAIEVTAPTTSARPAARPSPGRTAPRTGDARNVRRVFVYPTAPTPIAGTGLDVDKVPATVNAVGAAQIARTDSLNIADAL